jgi:hypothetical protein
VASNRAEQKGHSFKRPDAGPSEWSLVFDTETTTNPTQRLRFGSYQIRKHDKLIERGVFYDPEVLKRAELPTLRRYAKDNHISLITVKDFVEDVFFGIGYDRRANIIGFNLPFDISRLSRSHDSARSRNGSSMRGGFTLKLSEKWWRPRVQIKHHTRSLAFIQFAASSSAFTSKSGRKRKNVRIRRGFFLDLKTVAAALTSQMHSLASLSSSLEVAQKKSETTEHGKKLSAQYIAYAIQDAEATSECFVALRQRFDNHQLRKTRLNNIFSEASLGKAYLRELGIVPWRTMQPEFPPELIGFIMSTYYGGRAEIRIRRLIAQVQYCDFTSMYPTVCTLMRLWDFVVAKRMTWSDSAKEAQNLLNRVTLSDLQKPEFWLGLRTIVQVQPDADIFPVRARYADQAQFTIGLNYLSSEFPMWFTLADCIAAKLLTGKAPKVLQAYTFSPGGLQSSLWPVNIMGNPEYRVDPAKNDFYRSLIDLRMAVQEKERHAKGESAAKFGMEQFALKILANATSYGIFVELNVEELAVKQSLQRFGATGKAEPISSDKMEEPGNYYHPLLGTLITGAARLMLAIAERLARDSALDWAFCDTDSMALAKPTEMKDREFYKRAQTVRDWFIPLNPYASNVELFKIEDENKRLVGGKTTDALAPLFSYAVSAKRYALFNFDKRNRLILRKVSAHGLGHWLPPYEDDNAPPTFRKPAAELEGVRRWQRDIWHRIITAALADRDTNSNPAAHASFDRPVASPYHATTPAKLRWFDAYNSARSEKEQVRPFNFLLSFQIHPLAQQASADGIPNGRRRKRRRNTLSAIRPVAPYDSDPIKAAKNCFDRQTGKRVSKDDLESYREALAQYHLYPENKFLNGRHRDRGPTMRRHVKIGITDIHYIGKEANELEEQVFLGFDPEAQHDYGMEGEAYAKLLKNVQQTIKLYKLDVISRSSGISSRYLRKIRAGTANVSVEILKSIDGIIPGLQAAHTEQNTQERQLLEWARAERERIGIRELAYRLATDPANLAKVLASKRQMSRTLFVKLVRLSGKSLMP